MNIKTNMMNTFTDGIANESNVAFLSNEGRYTVLSFNDMTLRIIAPESLINYEKVVAWDNPVLTVVALYGKESVEDYVDLEAALSDLMIDTAILNNIKGIELRS